MTLLIGSRFNVSVDGKLDAEAQDIEVKYNGDPVPIATMVKDLAGFYFPPKSATVTIKGFLPVGVPSVDYETLYLTNKFVDVLVFKDDGSKYIRAVGVVNAPSASSSLNESSRRDITLTVAASPPS